MRDNLDLAALMQRGENYRRQSRRRRLRNRIILVVILAFGSWLWLGTRPLGALYRYQDNIWQKVTIPFLVTPQQVRVSADGVM